jgi:hypothetical protein
MAGSVWLVSSDVPRQRTAWLGRCGSGLEWEAGLDLVGSGGVRFGRFGLDRSLRRGTLQNGWAR